MDKVYHFLLCFTATTILGWQIGATVGVTVELTQVEGYYRKHGARKTIKTYWWKDTFLDLIFDGIGIILGTLLRQMIGW